MSMDPTALYVCKYVRYGRDLISAKRSYAFSRLRGSHWVGTDCTLNLEEMEPSSIDLTAYSCIPYVVDGAS